MYYFLTKRTRCMTVLVTISVVQVERSQMTFLTHTKVLAMVKKVPGILWDATKALILFLWEIIRNPRSLRDKVAVAQHHLVEVRHPSSCSSNGESLLHPGSHEISARCRRSFATVSLGGTTGWDASFYGMTYKQPSRSSIGFSEVFP